MPKVRPRIILKRNKASTESGYGNSKCCFSVIARRSSKSCQGSRGTNLSSRNLIASRNLILSFAENGGFSIFSRIVRFNKIQSTTTLYEFLIFGIFHGAGRERFVFFKENHRRAQH